MSLMRKKLSTMTVHSYGFRLLSVPAIALAMEQSRQLQVSVLLLRLRAVVWLAARDRCRCPIRYDEHSKFWFYPHNVALSD